jgi:hypothetical protein
MVFGEKVCLPRSQGKGQPEFRVTKYFVKSLLNNSQVRNYILMQDYMLVSQKVRPRWCFVYEAAMRYCGLG